MFTNTLRARNRYVKRGDIWFFLQLDLQLPSADNLILSCSLRWFFYTIDIVLNMLQGIVHDILANVNGFTTYYTMFKTTSVVRCSQNLLIIFESNSVWFESPLSQCYFVLFLTSPSLLLYLINIFIGKWEYLGKKCWFI